MKKWLCILLLLLPLTAWAEPARDVTAEVEIAVAGRDTDLPLLWDGKWASGITAPGNMDQYVWITPGREPVAAVYIEFGRHTSAVQAEAFDGYAWRALAPWTDASMGQVLLRLPAQSGMFRLHFRPQKDGDMLYLRELHAFTAGELEDAPVRDWLPPAEKADILFVVAHPDDELLWFAGAIPSCVNAGRTVQVVYLTCNHVERRQELLCGLWHCGVRHYPHINQWEDTKDTYLDALWRWGQREKAVGALADILRRYRPEVVVTHGVKGESGHIQHILCSELVQEAVKAAAEPSELPAWQVRKLYLHGGDEPTLRMDWSIPLANLGGKDGLTLAREAFELHASQNHRRYHVQEPGEKNDSTLFTLVATTVGEDAVGGNLFENIPSENLLQTP